ncbi:hypothetical protein Slin_4348 [Spirosoma linguale DSM 74]|uniref:Uncharacterized protein n=1 Tax=Spirosoma linguale (strain ATCC 33905 / DSM 74 / LMG 10896 / Claus 1) TaxID=504472 RepID=D2QLP0_SPILD|nr:hypothetical protein Slin_4348 [Spirosoma linguale DSM 74]
MLGIVYDYAEQRVARGQFLKTDFTRVIGLF